MKHKKPNISRTFLFAMIFISFLSIGIAGFLWIYSEYTGYRKTVARYEQDYIEAKKNILKYEVERAIDYIEYKRSQTEERLKLDIRNRTYEAYNIAMNLIQRHRGIIGDQKIQTIVKDALRPIWYNKGRGYYFATDLDGMEHLFSDRPELEGKNLLGMQDADGKYVIRDMIALVKKEGEGFYRYKWTKPGFEGRVFPKIAFIKHLEPFDWFIGTGEYLDDVEMDIQLEVIDRIQRIKFGKDGYIFGGTYEGVSISGPARGTNMLGVTDPNGVKIVQELIAAAKSGGGFVRYVMPQFEGMVNTPKLSYANSVDAWGWYIGAGLYVGEIEDVIAREKNNLNKRISRHLAKILAMLLGITIVIVFLVKIFSGRVKDSLDRFTSFFSEASMRYNKIDVNSLEFIEFENLARSANRMIDARNLADKEIKESKEWLETILISIHSGIVVIDADRHRIVDANTEAIKMFGAPIEEIVGSTCHKYICPEEEGRCPITELKKKVDKEERVLLTADGSKVPVIKTVNRVKMGEANLLIESFIDISDKKRLERKLQESQKLEAVGTLAGGIAHDFNNLMLGMQGRASLMMEDLDPSHPFYEHLSSILEYVSSAVALTRQLLGFARGGKYHVEPTDMNEILRHQSRLFGRTKKEIIMTGQYEENLWMVEADQGQMIQVLLNLFVNAWQAMPDGGSIFFSTENVVLENDSVNAVEAPPGRYVKIEISDTGIGMDARTLERIFDPFFTTKEKGRGTGLGLASVYGIVKNHQGFISARSRLGEGAKFEIWLPASDKKTAKKVSGPGEITKGSGTVLLVDDEELVMEVAQEMLKSLGYSVIPANSGKQAVSIFKEQWNIIDVVILDMIMPVMGGGETFDQLKVIDPEVTVILSSGYSIDGEASQIMGRGCSGFIQKPLSLQLLSSKIKEVL